MTKYRLGDTVRNTETEETGRIDLMGQAYYESGAIRVFTATGRHWWFDDWDTSIERISE